MKKIICTLFSQLIHHLIVKSAIVLMMIITTSSIFVLPILFEGNLILFQTATAQQEQIDKQPLAQSSIPSSSSSSGSFSSQSQINNANDKNTTGNTSSGYLTYDNPILGMKIQYPANWSVQEYPYNDSAAYNVVTGFYSPSKTGSQPGNVSDMSVNFVPYVDILVFASNGMSLNDIVQQKINNFLNNADFAIDNNQSKPFTLKGNHPAYMLVYTVIVGGDEFFRKRQVWTIFDDKVYVITFTSQQASSSDYIPIVDKMINSFEVQTKTTK
jgi:PsbP-like protein